MLLWLALLEAVWVSATSGSIGLMFLLPTLIFAFTVMLKMARLGLAIRNVPLGTVLRCVDVYWSRHSPWAERWPPASNP